MLTIKTGKGSVFIAVAHFIKSLENHYEAEGSRLRRHLAGRLDLQPFIGSLQGIWPNCAQARTPSVSRQRRSINRAGQEVAG